MRYACKQYPTPDGEFDWCAVLAVRISNPKRHSPPSRRFEALIDTGASRCIFHAQIGEAVGFDVRKGHEEQTVGVSGKPTIVYLHTVNLYVGTGIVVLKAGFCYELPLAALLGRRGFLENFKFTFDPSGNPPMFDLERINRA
ncbi:MAG: aspartyl protease family protein [Candidatus Acidiferrales bacterium]